MKDNQFANEMRIPSAFNEYQQLTAYSALRFAALRVSGLKNFIYIWIQFRKVTNLPQVGWTKFVRWNTLSGHQTI